MLDSWQHKQLNNNN